MGNGKGKVPSPEELYEAARRFTSHRFNPAHTGHDCLSDLSVDQKNYFLKLARLGYEYGIPCGEVEKVLNIVEKYDGQPSLSSTLKFHKTYSGGDVTLTEAYAILQGKYPKLRKIDDFELPTVEANNALTERHNSFDNLAFGFLLYQVANKPEEGSLTEIVESMGPVAGGLNDVVGNNGLWDGYPTQEKQVLFYQSSGKD